MNLNYFYQSIKNNKINFISPELEPIKEKVIKHIKKFIVEGIEKDNVVDNIILECGEFETLYSDPYFMRSAIGVWSKKHYRTFEKWIAALNLEYNPIYS